MSKAKWNDQLSSEQLAVLKDKATEAPFSGEYDGLYADGVYACANCGQVLFESGTKFDAHCGWPSFYDAKPGAVYLHTDASLGMDRTEVTCANCGGHLGCSWYPDPPKGCKPYTLLLLYFKVVYFS